MEIKTIEAVREAEHAASEIIKAADAQCDEILRLAGEEANAKLDEVRTKAERVEAEALTMLKSESERIFNEAQAEAKTEAEAYRRAAEDKKEEAFKLIMAHFI